MIPGSADHSMLLFTLYNKDYYYDLNIPLDGCRGEDGLDIRRSYLEHYGDGFEAIELELRTCSVLEWLLGMAIRCEEQIMRDDEEGNRTSLWFWSMLDNMDISSFTDDIWNVQSRVVVNSIVDDILLRNFPSDGSGSPFPLRESCEDITKCDWWRALNLWLHENFGDDLEF